MHVLRQRRQGHCAQSGQQQRAEKYAFHQSYLSLNKA
jgi:hypothetical protein